MEYTPVDHDPFATAPGNSSGAAMTPVDYDPFAGKTPSQGVAKLTPVDHDPFAEKPFTDRAISAAKTGAELIGKGAERAFWQLPASVNKFLGLGAFPATRDIFVTPAEQKAKEAEQGFEQSVEGAPFWERVGKSAAYGVGQLATLPVDIAMGAGMKAAGTGAKVLEAIPSFALGMGIRKAGDEGVMGFPEGVAEGLAMHGVGELGQGLSVIPRVAAQAAGQGALAAGMTTADTLAKTGRLPTGEQVAESAATGAAMGVPFALTPRPMSVERPRDSGVRVDTRGGDAADSLHGVADTAELGRLNATTFPGSSSGNHMTSEQLGAWMTDAPAGRALAATIADLRAAGYGDLADKVQVTSANQGEHARGSLHYQDKAVDTNARQLSPDEQGVLAHFAGQNGLVRDVAGEPWHFSYRGQPGGDADYLARVRQAESGGDDNARAATSSASGPYQFTDGTWRAMVQQYGQDYGLTPDGKSDPTQQATAAALLTRDNRDALRTSLGREPSNGDLYLAHVFGRTGAERILDGMAENPGAEAIGYASPATVRANRSLFFAKDHTRTLQEVYDILAAKVAPKDGETPRAETGARGAHGALPTVDAVLDGPQTADTWPLRPELADLRTDMEQRAPGAVEGQDNPWDMRSPAARIDAGLGIDTPLGRQAELASLRQDIQSRDVAARAADEMGAPVPGIEAERIGQRPALPEGQGFDMVPDAERRDRLPVRLEDAPTMPAQDVRFHLNDKPAEAFRGISPEDVAHGIDGYTEAAPGAAPVQIVRTQAELPQHILEEYRRSGETGAIEGVYDRSTRSVWLVSDNLESKTRAGEIWLHENVAHHGLRAVFGSDKSFDAFLKRNAPHFGYGSDHIAMEEHIARLAEKMDVGQALTHQERTLWSQFVQWVRSWLVRHGWATPSTEDLHNLLRDSLVRMSRENSGQDAAGGARFRVSGQDKDVLERDTNAAVKAMAEGMKRDIGPLARWFGTPDYSFQKHPVAWKIYNIFRDRPNRAHEILHTALDLPDGSTIMDRWKALPDKDKAMVNRIIDVADVREIKRPAVEQWMAEQNIPEPAREMYRLMRGKYDALLEERLRPYKEMLDKGVNPDIQYRDADGKLVTMSLKEAVGEMGRMQGFYAPRIRQNGDLAVLARRKLPGGDYEYARHHVEWKRQAKGLEKELRAQGWEITGMEPVARLGESTQQAIARVGEVAKVVESAAQGMKGAPEDARKAFLESLVEELSTEIKARGFRSSAIRRTGREGRVVRGYIEDAGERFAQYAQRTSYGIAKMESAQEAVRTLFTTGPDGRMLLDPRREPRTFEMVQNYLQDQLRNAERADRVISLGKSIATFKYLGLNPKSALVNLTTLATQVPPALRVYAGDSKVSLLRVNHELTRSLPDAIAWMLGKSRKGLNPEERAFLAEIQRKDLDDPQFAREAFKTYQATAGRVWSGAMNKAMLMFGATEQFNRLSTQLAGYRVARLAGASHQEAMTRALLASDRAHGVYGREAMPEAAWGTNAGARLMQLGYVYQKYAHNTLQLLADVWGKGDARSFMHLLAAPLAMGGVSTGMGAVGWTAAKAIYSTLGDSRDPKEAFFSWVRRALGQDAEQYARFGAFGALGIDVSGSMDTQIRMPASLKDLAGPIGGVVNDLVGDRGAAHYLATGQPGKALEKALPTGVSKPFQAMREATEGVTSSRGYSLRDEQGRNYMPTQAETATKAMGFRPAREARLKDMDFAAREEERGFQDRRNDILEAYRAWSAAGGTDRGRLDGIVSDIAKFNADVERFGRADVQPINQKSLESSLMRFRNASKQELGRRGMGDAPEADAIEPENFALADQMVRFREVKAKVNALYAQAEDLAQAGRMGEARQLAQRTGVVTMHDLIADIEDELRDAAALRKDAEEMPRLSGAQREAARRQADFMVRRALRFFEAKAAGWRQ